MSFEGLLRKKAVKLDELKLATVLLGHKEALKEELSQAKQDMASIMKGVDNMRQDLETMKAQSVRCRNLSVVLNKLDVRIVCMEEYLPAEFIQDFSKLSQAASPDTPNSNGIKETDQSQLVGRAVGIGVDTPEQRMADCKKTLFKNADDSYSIDLLSEEEFAKIPKYMIGRQTLAALNDLISAINQILESKYSLLAVGKDGARKKGKLDLYLSLKREEHVVASGKDPIYFFTAADYHRHTQSKLDKTKLNLLTALRHCKRLRELRAGKTLQYVLVPVWEQGHTGRGGIFE